MVNFPRSQFFWQKSLLPIPDYVTITYSCAVYVNNQKDLNGILEAFNFASKSYWGDKEKNIFYTSIDNYPITMEMNQGDNRKIYSIFTITVNAQLIPETINKNMSAYKKVFSKTKFSFTTEVEG
mgnify:CR=1 FL=1